ncbi:MAG: class I SAM-dependent methyltransferase [Bacteroidales bacterium]|jgi:SAM-dependent methyltransferase|nr:class I SAM-dependent methyltransferase [Bacteroidales bacterium]
MVIDNTLTKWNDTYKKGLHFSIWPWSDLISLVLRNTDIRKQKLSVLELGCGAGANIPFFQHYRADYYGIDGSKYIVHSLKKRYPKIKKNLVACDFTKSIPFNKKFDLIIDRAALTHNTSKSIENTLNLLKTKLKPKGMFIGIDWFSTKHSDYKKGKRINNDKYSRTNFNKGQFVGLGLVHFSTKRHIQALFKDYELIYLSHKILSTEVPRDKNILATWNIIALNN